MSELFIKGKVSNYLSYLIFFFLLNKLNYNPFLYVLCRILQQPFHKCTAYCLQLECIIETETCKCLTGFEGPCSSHH